MPLNYKLKNGLNDKILLFMYIAYIKKKKKALR